MKNLADSVYQALRERLKLVVVGTYTLAFVAVNIRPIAVVLLGSEPMEQRFDLAFELSNHWAVAYLVPAIITVAVTVGGAYADWWLVKIRKKAHGGMKTAAIRQDIDLEDDRMELVRKQVARDMHRAKQEFEIERERSRLEMDQKQHAADIQDSHERTKNQRDRAAIDAEERSLDQQRASLKQRAEEIERLHAANQRELTSMQNQKAAIEQELIDTRNRAAGLEKTNREISEAANKHQADLNSEIRQVKADKEQLLNSSVSIERYEKIREELKTLLKQTTRLIRAIRKFREHGVKIDGRTVSDLPGLSEIGEGDLVTLETTETAARIPGSEVARSKISQGVDT